MVSIEAFLAPEDVQIDLRAPDKQRLIEDLSAHAGARLGLNSKDICREVAAREALGSTGIGSGVSLPHARLEGLIKPFAAVARLKKPVAFDAIDGEPVDLVVFLLLPAAATDDNLKILALIARKLRDPERLKRLRQAADSQALLRELQSQGASEFEARER